MTGKLLGKVKGSFDDPKGIKVRFCNVFVAQAFWFPDGSNSLSDGFKTEKFKCSERMYDELLVEQEYEFFFDDRGRVAFVNEV